MANRKRIKLLEQLRKVGVEGGVDFLREGLKVLAASRKFWEVNCVPRSTLRVSS